MSPISNNKNYVRRMFNKIIFMCDTIPKVNFEDETLKRRIKIINFQSKF